MCIVHRIDASGKRIAVYEETAPTNPVQRYSPANNFVGRNMYRESFIERLRRMEINRLSGLSYRSDGLEFHQLSPQSSVVIEPVRFDDWYEGSGPRKHSHHGRNDRYKTNRHNRPTVW